MKKFLIAFVAGIILFSCSPRHTAGLHGSVALSCKVPAFLEPGDKVALISPSYHTPMENVEAAAGILRDWGFEPVVGAHVGKVHRGHYAGTTKERLADLEWALEDPEIKAILCNRGGYGTIRLVNRLSEEMICSYLEDYDIPVLCGFPAGHDDVNLPLLMGAPVTLDVTDAGATLTFHVEGRTRRIDTAAAVSEAVSTEKEIEKQREFVRILDFIRHFEGHLR
jgi:hypothetical protein